MLQAEGMLSAKFARKVYGGSTLRVESRIETETPAALRSLRAVICWIGPILNHLRAQMRADSIRRDRNLFDWNT